MSRDEMDDLVWALMLVCYFGKTHLKGKDA